MALKILVTDLTPWQTFGLRLILAVPLFYIFEKLLFNTRIDSKLDLLKIAGLGFLGVSIIQSSIALGVHLTSVFHTGFLVGMGPLATLILSVMLKRERLTLPKVLGTLIAFMGLFLLLSVHSGQEPLPATFLWGDIIVFLNITGWAVFLVLSQPLVQKYPPFSVISYAFTFAGIITIPIVLWTCHGVPGLNLSLNGWLWMGFVVIFSTIFTYFLNYYALAKVSAGTVAVYIFLQPFLTAIFAHWVLHEPITGVMILYGCIILSGVATATESYRPLQQLIRIKRRPV